MTTLLRHENKFIVDEATLQILAFKLDPLTEADQHQRQGFYRVRSLYFDDLQESAVFDNDAGTDERRKFRIRVYDDPRDRIRLEIKHKIRGKTLKESALLSENMFYEILSGRLAFKNYHPRTIQLLYLQRALRGLRPSIIVEYRRSVYKSPDSNVRITMDRDISYSSDFERFLESHIMKHPLLPAGKHILEVKFDKVFPEYLAQAMETGELQRTTFSKFYLSKIAQKERE